MNKKKNTDQFNVLRKINSKPEYSQRELASELGFSLGKLNYCLKALKDKGLIKINNFQKNPNKLGLCLYVNTKRNNSENKTYTGLYEKKNE